MTFSQTTPSLSPAIADLVRAFPLPAAAVHLDGLVGFVNDRLAACFGAACLETSALREVISLSDPVWRALRLRTVSGEEVDVLAQSIRHFPYVILMIDDTTGAECAGEVEGLRRALLERQGVIPVDAGATTDADGRSHNDTVMDAEMTRSGRFKQPLSLALIEIDRDGAAGKEDERRAAYPVLAELMRTLRAGLRMADQLFRWDDDRFVVLAPVTDYRHAYTLATGLRIIVQKHEFASGSPLTVSIGVSELMDGEQRDAWFGRAERVLRDSKDTGGNSVAVDPRGRADAWVVSGETRPSRLVWLDSYECGHPLVDAQHRELFELTNELLEITTGGTADSARAHDALQRLLAHVGRHFADEERILASIEYPFLRTHRLAHRELLQRARAVAERVAAPGQGYGQVVEFLTTEVVANHVFGCDSDFFALVRQHCSTGTA